MNLWMKRFARYGSVSIGVVYIFIGVIAILSLLRLKDGGADEDSLLELLAGVWLGEVLLWVILGGILCYMMWRIYEAIADPANLGNNKKGIIRRTAIALSALAYGTIAVSGIQAMTGTDDEEGFEEQRHFIASILAWDGGGWVIAIAGVCIGITALVEFRYVFLGDHRPQMDVIHLSKTKHRIIDILAWAGHLARSIILGIIAYSLIRGAIYNNAEETVNTDKAFNFIGESMLGHPFFVIVALGTICYGIFMIIFGIYLDFERDARWR
jgi:hypothetical protein